MLEATGSSIEMYSGKKLFEKEVTALIICFSFKITACQQPQRTKEHWRRQEE